MFDKPYLAWKEEDIVKLVSESVEENMHLEYKSLDSLGKTDSKKKEISKDVSVFANSDGGVIIYGIKEYDRQDKRHLPEILENGYEPSEISKEWLEQVIMSRVKPKIEGLLINPIAIASSTKVIYLISIPKSNTAHQASDFRYYKRYNFESTPMEDYEVRDVMNRTKYPVLSPSFNMVKLPNSDGREHRYGLIVKLINSGPLLVKYYQLEFTLPSVILVSGGYHGFSGGVARVRKNSMEHFRFRCVSTPDKQVIFPGQELTLVSTGTTTKLDYKVDDDIHDNIHLYSLHWILYADNMPYERGGSKISRD
ncbi:MAG: ATP-binding protein [Candidatus Omnitrophica bacterium]|nr:ATP-binding protein [Candidatus Omnitrophota bacterium]MBU1933272.1 ATP-binding protein [Candidatus Omnitrophota bacterium]